MGPENRPTESRKRPAPAGRHPTSVAGRCLARTAGRLPRGSGLPCAAPRSRTHRSRRHRLDQLSRAKPSACTAPLRHKPGDCGVCRLHLTDPWNLRVADARSRRVRDRFNCVDCGHTDPSDLSASANILASGTGAAAAEVAGLHGLRTARMFEEGRRGAGTVRRENPLHRRLSIAVRLSTLRMKCASRQARVDRRDRSRYRVRDAVHPPTSRARSRHLHQVA